MLIFIPLGNIRKTQIFYIFMDHEREYWNVLNYNIGESRTIWFEFCAWNASSSIVKQNYFKNKTTWLTQTALS